jgi:hypothetical protein
VAAAQVVGEIELVLVAKDEALLPEQFHELGEAGVVLIRKIGEISKQVVNKIDERNGSSFNAKLINIC